MTMVVKEEQLANAINQNRKLEAELESLRSILATHIGLITVWLLSVVTIVTRRSLEDLQAKLTALEGRHCYLIAWNSIGERMQLNNKKLAPCI